MAYTKQNWVNLDPATPLSAARLNHIESGIFDTAGVADDALAKVDDLIAGETAANVVDSFTDTNGTLLSAHTADSGETWDLDPASGLEIQSNKVSPLSAGARAISSALGFENVQLEATVNFGADGVSRAWALRFRRQDNDNFLFVKFRRSSTPVNQVELWERIGGVETRLRQVTLDAATFAADTDYAVRVEADGSTIRAWVADTLEMTEAGVTQLAASKQFGFGHSESVSTGQTLDSFVAKSLAGDVTSVNNKTGAVTLGFADVGAAAVDDPRFDNIPPVTDLVGDLLGKSLFYIAHRGSRDDFPEHTIDAYAGAVAADAEAIEVSVALTGDGVVVCNHDTTVDRLTTGTGAVSDFHYTGLRSVPISDDGWIGPGYGEVQWTALEEVLDKFLGKVVIFLEAKDTAALQPTLDMLDRFGAENRSPKLSVIGKGYKDGHLSTWDTAGYRFWSYQDFDTPLSEIQGYIAAGADAIGMPHSVFPGDTNTTSDADLQAVVAEGVPVICWEVHRKHQVTELQALGVQGMMSSAFLHVTRAQPSLTKDTFATKTRPPGDLPRVNANSWQPSWDGANEFVIGGGGGSGDANAYMLGSLSFDAAPNSYKVTFEMAYDDVPTDVNTHWGLVFAKPGDHAYVFGSTLNETGGYHIVFRSDGRMQLYRHEAGVASGTQLGSVATDAPVDSTWIPFELNVSPTGITLDRTDGVFSQLSTSDTTYRGGYFHLSRTWNIAPGAGDIRFRNIDVTVI